LLDSATINCGELLCGSALTPEDHPAVMEFVVRYEGAVGAECGGVLVACGGWSARAGAWFTRLQCEVTCLASAATAAGPRADDPPPFKLREPSAVRGSILAPEIALEHGRNQSSDVVSASKGGNPTTDSRNEIGGGETGRRGRMMIMEAQRAAMLGMGEAPTAEEIKARARFCAELFLDGCRVQ
jgi:hypothetical protein